LFGGFGGLFDLLKIDTTSSGEEATMHFNIACSAWEMKPALSSKNLCWHPTYVHRGKPNSSASSPVDAAEEDFLDNKE
jgi:hypothetical protein